MFQKCKVSLLYKQKLRQSCQPLSKVIIQVLYYIFKIVIIIFFILGQSYIKITGTGTIVNGKTSLNINVQIDGNGGGSPAVGSQLSAGKGGEFPQVGGRFPGRGGRFPHVWERFPGKGGRLPQIEGKIPGLGERFPGAGRSQPTQKPTGTRTTPVVTIIGREGGSPEGMWYTPNRLHKHLRYFCFFRKTCKPR